jgi:hypothetical protein
MKKTLVAHWYMRSVKCFLVPPDPQTFGRRHGAVIAVIAAGAWWLCGLLNLLTKFRCAPGMLNQNNSRPARELGGGHLIICSSDLSGSVQTTLTNMHT